MPRHLHSGRYGKDKSTQHKHLGNEPMRNRQIEVGGIVDVQPFADVTIGGFKVRMRQLEN